MKYFVCAVRDRAIDSFAQPMFVAAHGQAIRAFGDEINNKANGNPLAAHPEDFDLYALGLYESDTGLFETDAPRQLAVGKDLVRGQ